MKQLLLHFLLFKNKKIRNKEGCMYNFFPYSLLIHYYLNFVARNSSFFNFSTIWWSLEMKLRFKLQDSQISQVEKDFLFPIFVLHDFLFATFKLHMNH